MSYWVERNLIDLMFISNINFLTQLTFIFLLALSCPVFILVFSKALFVLVKQNIYSIQKKKWIAELEEYLTEEDSIDSVKEFDQTPWIFRGFLEDFIIEAFVEFKQDVDQAEKIKLLWEKLGFNQKNTKLLLSRSEHRKVRAVLILGIFQQKDLISKIRRHLQDSSKKVRWATAFALFSLKDEKSIQHILEAIHDVSLFNLVQIQPYLYELGREGVFSLEESLQHPEPDIRILALGIITRLRQKEFVNFLLRLVDDPILDVRMKALSALVSMSTPQAKSNSSAMELNDKIMVKLEGVLEQQLQKASWQETARILQVIGACKIKSFLAFVEEQITHLHPWVRYRALETLLLLGKEGKLKAKAILEEHRHLVFPIFQDLDLRHDISE